MTDEAQTHLRRNFLLGVTNGVIFMAGSSLLNPTTILPKFLETVFDSKALIGVGSYLILMGWSLPQLPAAYFARSLRRRKPVYIWGNTARMTLTALFVLAFFFFRKSPGMVGLAYFVFLGAAGIAAGAVGLAYQDIVSRTIPSTRRGAYNAYRIFGGQGLTALAGSIFVKYVLDHPDKFPYPQNYLLFFALAWAMMTIGVVAFSFMKEPAEASPKPRPSPRAFLLELYLILKINRNYRRFLFQKCLRACELFAIPYYILFATDRLGLGEGAVGTFQIVTVATMLAAAIWWGKVSDTRGNQRVIRYSTIAALSVPLAALSLAVLSAKGFLAGQRVAFSAAGISVSVGTTVVLTVMMSALFALIAASSAGSQIGFQNYLMDAAPARRRPIYLGMTTTIDGLLLIALPAIGGAIIDAADYWVVFLVTAIVLAASAVLSRGLREPRAVVSRR